METTAPQMYEEQIKNLREHARVSLPLLSLKAQDIDHYMNRYAGVSRTYDWVDEHFRVMAPYAPNLYTQRFHVVIVFPGHSLAVRFNDATAQLIIPPTLSQFNDSSPFVEVTYFNPILGQVLSGATLWFTSLDPASLTLPNNRTISEELVQSTWSGWPAYTSIWTPNVTDNSTNTMNNNTTMPIPM